jgi:flavin reductase (DIM6/NTAB) family NADH-FMN oxidoreductase RutF
MEHSVTTADFKAAMASFAAGVTVITTLDDSGRPFALTATAFASVSKNPPLCLVSVSHDAEAHPVISAMKRFAVNLLSRDQQGLSSRFATSGIEKFDGVAWTPGDATGCPLLAETLASVECTVSSVLTAGDHDIFIGAIQRIVLGSGDPLVYFRGGYCDVTRR